MFKFIHIGDVHLDTTFYSKDNDIREKLRNSLRDSFKEVIDTCIREEVHGLLIAGDLFDHKQLSFQTEEMLLNSFKKLKEHQIKVFYATGNHDPGDSSFMRTRLDWPDNVTIFGDDKIKVVEVLDQQGQIIGKIVGVGHKTAKEARNLIKDFPTKEGNVPYVGLVHTMVTNATGVEKHDRYLPCSIEDLQLKGYDYWALGHIHQFQEIGKDHKIYYSGNLQGRNPKETGAKGGLLVTIDPQVPSKIKFISFSKVIWHSLSIDGLETVSTYSQLKDYLIEYITDYLKKAPQGNEGILRIELLGRSLLKEELQQEENRQQLEADLKFYFNLMEVKIKTEDLLIFQNVDDYKDGQNVLAKTLQLLEGLEGLKDDEELLNSLLTISFANKKLKTREEKINYLLMLSRGLQEEAVYRMVGDDK
ncbi:metallophosphoesterase family protein [Alkaliphilus transvaalensis]|uniref:metallophosphoesterase family protein n=1 Tax=Alkaliphilus transvaalensis TaxID=114628 RepID=UPI0004799014|nr:DNA repair exonuclease [Alkaliphilus transvaalensis]